MIPAYILSVSYSKVFSAIILYMRGIQICLINMVSESQRQFNRFIDGYMDKRQKGWGDSGSLFSFSRKPAQEQKPKAREVKPLRVDKAVLLAEKEMDMTMGVPDGEKKEKKGSKSIFGAIKKFLASPSDGEEKLTKADMDRFSDEEDFRVDNIQQSPTPRPIQRQAPRPIQHSSGAANAYFSDALRRVNGVSGGSSTSSMPQQRPSGSPGLSSGNFRPVAAAPQRRVEVEKVEENFPYNPTTEKDFKYLLGLVDTLLNKLEKSKKDDFYRSSEFRIFESIRKRH
jgi:hypothetical protein